MRPPRYLRFSLKHVAVLVTLACIALALCAEYARRQRAAAFIDGLLGPRNSLTTTHKLTYDEEAALAKYQDQRTVAAELFRRLNDQQSLPGDQVYFEALRTLIDAPGVVDGLLAILESSTSEKDQEHAMSALADARTDGELIVERLTPFTRVANYGPRAVAYYSLVRMAAKQPLLRPRIVPTLIAGMSDSDEFIRMRAAGAFNTLGSPEAAPALTRLLDDPNRRVQVDAARSLWKVTGNREPLVRKATDILEQDGEIDIDIKSVAAHWLIDAGELPPATLKVLKKCAADEKPLPYANHEEHQLSYLAREAQRVLKAQAALSAESAGP